MNIIAILVLLTITLALAFIARRHNTKQARVRFFQQEARAYLLAPCVQRNSLILASLAISGSAFQAAPYAPRPVMDNNFDNMAVVPLDGVRALLPAAAILDMQVNQEPAAQQETAQAQPECVQEVCPVVNNWVPAPARKARKAAASA